MTNQDERDRMIEQIKFMLHPNIVAIENIRVTADYVLAEKAKSYQEGILDYIIDMDSIHDGDLGLLARQLRHKILNEQDAGKCDLERSL